MYNFNPRVQDQRKPSLKGKVFNIGCTALYSAAKITDFLAYSAICINLCPVKHILCTSQDFMLDSDCVQMEVLNILLCFVT